MYQKWSYVFTSHYTHFLHVSFCEFTSQKMFSYSCYKSAVQQHNDTLRSFVLWLTLSDGGNQEQYRSDSLLTCKWHNKSRRMYPNAVQIFSKRVPQDSAYLNDLDIPLLQMKSILAESTKMLRS